MIDESEGNEKFTRRLYLKVAGSATAVAIGGTQVAAAEDQGYGTSGYGTGSYGGQVDDGSTGDDEESDAVPTIEELTGKDGSNPRNPHVDAELYWRATSDNPELHAASLSLSDSDGKQIESWTYDLSGLTAEETETTRVKHGARGGGTEYTVDLIVYSDDGETDTQTTTFKSQ